MLQYRSRIIYFLCAKNKVADTAGRFPSDRNENYGGDLDTLTEENMMSALLRVLLQKSHPEY